MVKPAEVKIDEETLSKQDGISDDQAEAIALAAIAEMDKEKKPGEKEAGEEQGKEKSEGAPKEETALSDEELLAAEDEGLSDDQKTKKAELVKAQETKEKERILNAKNEDLGEEDKAKKAEIVKAQEEEKAKTGKEEISAYAKEHNVTEDEAREDLEHIAKIQEKYKGDPKQLAKANLHLQRLHSKSEAELKSIKDAKPSPADVKEVPIAAVEKWLEEGKIQYNGKNISRDEVIEAYRKAYPDLTDSLDDEKVFKLAAKETKERLDKHFESQRAEISAKAKEKRATIFDSVAEADKQFIPEIKPLVEKLSDTQIMDERFSLDTYITYAKGKAFDTLQKQVEEEKRAFGEKEYKRGLEEAKILGVKRPPDGKPPKSGADAALTDEQKKRAREMFDNPDITEEQSYKLYKEYLKETKQA